MAGGRPRTASAAVVALVVAARGVSEAFADAGKRLRRGGDPGRCASTCARVPRGDDDRRECRVETRGKRRRGDAVVRVVPVPVPVVEGVGAGVTIGTSSGREAERLGSGRGCHGGDASPSSVL